LSVTFNMVNEISPITQITGETHGEVVDAEDVEAADEEMKMAIIEPKSGLIIASKEPLNPKKPVRKWERRWVLQPNILDSGEIWI
jgi:hypothetical protein